MHLWKYSLLMQRCTARIKMTNYMVMWEYEMVKRGIITFNKETNEYEC